MILLWATFCHLFRQQATLCIRLLRLIKDAWVVARDASILLYWSVIVIVDSVSGSLPNPAAVVYSSTSSSS